MIRAISIHISFKLEKDNNNNDSRLETLLHRLQKVEYNSINSMNREQQLLHKTICYFLLLGEAKNR